MYQRILIATDGSELAARAVTHGIALAKSMGAPITIVRVTEPFPFFATNPEILTDTPASYAKHAKEAATKTLDAAVAAAKAAEVSCEAIHVEHAHPYEAIIKTAHSRVCDLIVMASHGRRGVSAIVLGSETVKVLTHSTIPVLVYR